MTARVLLHIGAMKTGTTYLQALLQDNRKALRRAGVLVAPERAAAVHDLMDHQAAGPAHRESVRGAWDRTSARMRSHDGWSVLSHEYLSFVGPKVVERVATTFDVETHVLVTVRDAAATLPAQWQTFARNRGTMTWPEYAAAARDPRTGPRDHTFLRSQRVDRMLRLWADVGQLHVVTVPARGGSPDVLWERVASVLRIDPELAPERTGGANVSVGYASAHLLCLLHQNAAHLPPAQVRRLTMHLATTVLTQRRDTEPRPPLDSATRRFASDWNARTRDAISASGAHLAGTLEDLPVLREGHDPGGDAIGLPDDSDVLAAAADAIRQLSALLGVPESEAPTADVTGAVNRLVGLVESALSTGAVDRLNARGTALRR